VLLENERAEVAEACRDLVREGLVKGTSGNVSVRSGDAGELVAISPGSVAYEELTPRDICVVDLHGNVVEGARSPSSELRMHLGVYARTAARAAVHSHSPYTSVLSTLIEELPAIHYMIVTLGGPVRVTDYELFGSAELAEEAGACLADRHAVILGSHGGMTVGNTLREAFQRSVTLEWLCQLYYRAARFGSPRIMTPEQLDAVAAQMRHYAYAKDAFRPDQSMG
jgi:L-fuculose-phosphate aldolase